MLVIFVCTANVCRSPLAEGYLRDLLQKRKLDGVELSSAGVAALVGAPPFECAAETAQRFGFSITSHRSRQLTPEMIAGADKILCMEAWQANAVIEMAPESMDRVALLGSFHPRRQLLMPIPDPRDFSVKETLPVFELIQNSVDGYLESLVSRPAATGR
jgi:protein-tyrosine phosphatase